MVRAPGTTAGGAGSGANTPGSDESSDYTPANIAWVLQQYFKNPFGAFTEVQAIMVAIAMAESGGNRMAHNQKPPDNSYGLWQINMIGQLGPRRRAKYGLKSNDDLFAGSTNARVAYGIYTTEGGLQAWSTYKTGAYKQYLSAARAAVKAPKQPGNVGGGPDQTKYEGINALLNPVLGFLKEAGLRTAGFVGGVGLIGGAIFIVAKKGIK